jgi:hypothetical protein
MHYLLRGPCQLVRLSRFKLYATDSIEKDVLAQSGTDKQIGDKI